MKIEPCPHCGGEASVVQYVGDLYVVACDYCFVRTSKYSEKEKAISAWNRRKAPEIVHCGECKFSCKYEDSDIANYAGYADEVYCSEHDIYKHADWYCADAERRTDEAKRSD